MVFNLIIIRSPLRLSLVGGGTDLPDFFNNSYGVAINMTIQKYIYITFNALTESSDILLRYSQVERVKSARELNHPIVRTALEIFDTRGIEISVVSDLPAGTGLGSSSSFTVGMITGLLEFSGRNATKRQIAQLACDVEIKQLGEPIGLQDQYAASFGGLNHFTFLPNDEVKIHSLRNEEKLIEIIENCCLLVRVGTSRSASEILRVQKVQTSQGAITHHLTALRELAEEFSQSVPETPYQLGTYLNRAWNLKCQLGSAITNDEVDVVIKDAIRFGSLGGKLLGAGGSGFVLLVFEDSESRQSCRNRFFADKYVFYPKINRDGCAIIYRSDAQ